MRPIHNRQPVILGPEDFDAWLSPETPPEHLAALTQACPSDSLAVTPAE